MVRIAFLLIYPILEIAITIQTPPHVLCINWHEFTIGKCFHGHKCYLH